MAFICFHWSFLVYTIWSAKNSMETGSSSGPVHSFQLVHRRYQLPLLRDLAFLELCLYATSLPFSKKVLKSCLKSILYYIFSMFSGVLCSCILFLPTISAMRNSNRGQLDLYCLKNFSFTGNILTALSNYVFDSTSVYGCVSFSAELLPSSVWSLCFCRKNIPKTETDLWMFYFSFHPSDLLVSFLYCLFTV